MSEVDIVGAEAHPLDLVDSIVDASADGEITLDDLAIAKNRLQSELDRRMEEENDE